MRSALVGAIGGFVAAGILSTGYFYFLYPKSSPPKYGKLLDCKDKDSEYGDLDNPSFTYTITIPDLAANPDKDKFDFRHPVVKTEVAAGSGLAPSLADLAVRSTTKTRFDFKTKLQKKQSALIRIVLVDPTLTFLKEGAVWDPDPTGKNDQSKMLCDLRVATDHKSLTFILHAPKKNGTALKYHVSPNIGISVQDSGEPNTYSLPIFLDPDIENEGVYDP